MRRLATIGLSVVLAAAIPAGARAQAVSGSMKWDGTGNSFGWYWRSSNGSVTNAYGGSAYGARFKFNSPPPSWMWPQHGTSGFGPGVDIYCVDFLHHANTSSSGYNAWFTKLTTASFANPSSVHTRSNDLSSYLKAAWLSQKMNATPLSNKLVRADIHAAIWWIMSGQPVGTYKGSGNTGSAGNYLAVGSTGGIMNWVDQANANYTSVDGNAWTVVTDACVGSVRHNGVGATAVDGCSQEFLTQNVVPEPATLLLMGTGLLATLALSGVIRRPEA